MLKWFPNRNFRRLEKDLTAYRLSCRDKLYEVQTSGHPAACPAEGSFSRISRIARTFEQKSSLR
jgi:hypothetical protein